MPILCFVDRVEREGEGRYETIGQYAGTRERAGRRVRSVVHARVAPMPRIPFCGANRYTLRDVSRPIPWAYSPKFPGNPPFQFLPLSDEAWNQDVRLAAEHCRLRVPQIFTSCLS